MLLPAGIELPFEEDLTILPKPPTLVIAPGLVTGVKPEAGAGWAAAAEGCSDDDDVDDDVVAAGAIATEGIDSAGDPDTGAVTAGRSTGVTAAGVAAGVVIVGKEAWVTTAGADATGVTTGTAVDDTTFLTALTALTTFAGDFAFLTTVSTITSVFLAGLISGNWFNLVMGI